MKSAVLNVSIDTNTQEGEKLRDLILGGDNKNGWLCVAWVDRTKYNPVQRLKESEDAKRIAVIEAIRLNDGAIKMMAWIEKARDLMVYCHLYEKNNCTTLEEAKEFSKLIDEAPI